MDNKFYGGEAELAVLSILIKNPNKIFDLDTLSAHMFTSTPNKTVFSTIESLARDGMVPEYNLLINTLKAKNILNECGGEDYLKYLNNQDYNVESLNDFESLLVNFFKARSLVKLSTQIPEMITDNTKVDEVIHYVKTGLDNLSLVTGGENVLAFRDASEEAWETLVERVQNPIKITTSTGFSNMDSVTGGYWPGDLWVIGGRPSMGKTAWMVNSVLEGGKKGVPSLVFSLEMNKQILIYRMLAMETGISSSNIRFGLVSQSELELIRDKIRELKDLPIYIDSNFFANINYVTSTIRKYKKLYDIQVAHIDYLQLMSERGEDATHEIGRITREMKLLANSEDLTGVIYSQLNRECEKRPDKRPLLSDFRQSGNIEEDVDVAVAVYRDEVYNSDTKHKGVMENLIRKQRNGPIGTVFSMFDSETTRITDK